MMKSAQKNAQQADIFLQQVNWEPLFSFSFFFLPLVHSVVSELWNKQKKKQ